MVFMFLWQSVKIHLVLCGDFDECYTMMIFSFVTGTKSKRKGQESCCFFCLFCFVLFFVCLFLFVCLLLLLLLFFAQLICMEHSEADLNDTKIKVLKKERKNCIAAFRWIRSLSTLVQKPVFRLFYLTLSMKRMNTMSVCEV